MNVAPAIVRSEGDAVSVAVDAAVPGFAFPPELAGKLDGHAGSGMLKLGIRPEAVLVSREARPGYVPVVAHIIEPLGSHDIVDLKVGAEILRARTPSGFVAKAGEAVHARLDPAQAHFFDTSSGKSLGVRL
jgi:multiple sugar transport system ATP-binding protein